MERPLNILLLEDVATDAELIIRQLRRAGIQCDARCVATEPDFRRGLDEYAPDLILSDFSLPSFDGLRALDIARELLPDVPYVFVSGTIGEERAIESIKRGATDYVLKTNLPRLVPCVQRALKEARERAERKQMERDLRASEERFRLLVNGVTDYAIFMLDAAGKVASWNTGAERITGYAAEEIVGRDYAVFHPPERSDQVAPESQLQTAAKEGHLASEILQQRKDGSLFWANVALTALYEEREARGFAVVIRDVSERRAAAQKIARLSRIHAVLSGINSAIVRIRDRRELFQEACRIAVEDGNFAAAWVGRLDSASQQVEPVAAAGPDTGWLINPPDRAREDSQPRRGLVGEAIRQRRARFSNDLVTEDSPAGSRRAEALRRGYRSIIVLPLFSGDAIVGTLSLIAREAGFFNGDEIKLLNQLAADISFALDHIAKEERISHLAYYDALTGLPNRTLFHDRLTRLLQPGRADRRRLALLLSDIPRFRLVNESLGRQAGDTLLQEVADRFAAVWPDKGDVARVGPNTFASVLREARDAHEVAQALETMLGAVTTPAFELEGQELQIALTTGIAFHPDDAADADALFRNAEAALLKAKRSGERYLFYEPEMNARVAKTLTLENKLRRAIEREQFVLHYQPKVDLRNNRVVGLEALIRWNDPDTGLVPPMEFIPILEETGMILEVGRWAIEKAVQEYCCAQAAHVPCPRIAVNVSAIQLRRRDFVAVVREAIERSRVHPHGLDLEITESLAMENVTENIPKLRALQEMGVDVSIDDFGTGYSSLGYISKLPVAALKIDRSFIVNMATSADDLSIVSTVISLAHDLGLKVVAEGVDSNEQAKLLRLVKCDQMQGYLISRPVAAENVGEVLERIRAQAAAAP